MNISEAAFKGMMVENIDLKKRIEALEAEVARLRDGWTGGVEAAAELIKRHGCGSIASEMLRQKILRLREED